MTRLLLGLPMVLTATSAWSAVNALPRADLIAVYQAAAQNDAMLSGARHAYQAQIEAVPQARAGLLPSLTAGKTILQGHPSRTR